MRFVIMADGKGKRWNTYMGIPKHLAIIDGETIIGRTVRLLCGIYMEEKEIIITSHDPRYEFDGSIRYEPKNNILEIDRFTEELIQDDICFMYGDTFYTKNTINKIITIDRGDITFFGNKDSIVAIKIRNKDVFIKHIRIVRDLFIKGEIDKCVGWQVYQSYTNQLFKKTAMVIDNIECFVKIDDLTFDIDTPEEYEEKMNDRDR